MAYLFDTDALSEPLKRQPSMPYVRWLQAVPRTNQFTSAVCIGELFKGAFRVPDADRHILNIEMRVLPAVTVLPFDVAVARVYGEIEAALSGRGQRLADADLQIAATALHHGLELVTGNVRHFARVPRLRVSHAFASTR